MHHGQTVPRRRPPDPEIERRLREYGRTLDDDGVPAFSDRVRARLEESGEASRRSWIPTLRLAAAALAAGAVAVAAVPAARTNLLDALGLRSVRVVAVEALPSVAARGPLRAGSRLSFAAARRVVRFRILLPDGRRPDLLFVGSRSGRDAVPGGVVTLVYGRVGKPRLLVQQFLGTSPGPELLKRVGSRAKVERVMIDGAAGIWFGGAHAMSFVDADGVTRGAATRLAGEALVWQAGNVIVRIEGRFDKDEAIKIARSIA